MIFVPANELKTGMRLAKPIYNKKGVLLYDTGFNRDCLDSVYRKMVM